MPRAYWHTHIAMPIASEMRVARLGEARIPNPFSTSYIDDRERLVHPALLSDVQHYLDAGEELPSFEIAGPREHL
jgi:hypothetical protein